VGFLVSDGISRERGQCRDAPVGVRSPEWDEQPDGSFRLREEHRMG
jgi:hypothetical protein